MPRSPDTCARLRRGIAGLTVIALAAALAPPAPAAPPERPNIVLFLVDDLGWQDVSVPLHSQRTPFNDRYRTPNLERLAARGMRFTQAYASAPVCTPTRTSIMTGRSPGRTHITYWTLHRDRDTSRPHDRLDPPAWRLNGLQAGDVTLPTLLRDAGYRTIHVGKAHFGTHDTSGGDPLALGFTVNIAGHASGGPASYYGTHDFSQAGKHGDPAGGASVWDIPGLEKYHGEDVYLTEALAIEASEAIRQSVADGVPFYLNMAPYAVHAPIMANPRYLDRYAGPHATEAAYATMIETVDAALGTIVETLEATGVREKTIIIFTSDNGGLSAHARGGIANTHNAPLRSGKGSAYEGGTRVPAVVAWPGVTAADSVSDVPIVSHDLFPTILAMAGVDVPAGYAPTVDGVDLTLILRGARVAPRPRVIGWNQPHQWGARGPGIEPFTSIRLGQWKLIYFHANRRFELYDLAGDVGESHDLAASRPRRVERMVRQMDEWIERVDGQLSIDRQTGREIERPLAALHSGRK